jgi:hypothetical protein
MTHLELVHFLMLLGKGRNCEARAGKVGREKSKRPYLAATAITCEKFPYNILVKYKPLGKCSFDP